MNHRQVSWKRAWLGAILLVAAAPVLGQDPAASALLVVGPVQVQAVDGARRVLLREGGVVGGERVLTGAGGYASLAFTDGSRIVLRPDSEFLIESYAYGARPKAPAPIVAVPASRTDNRASLRLLRGGLRAVTGLIASLNRSQYQVLTPMATIGIRGTVFAIATCDALCAADPVISAAVAGSGESALGGLVSAVEQGGISLRSLSGAATSLDAEQYLLTTASGRHLPLPRLPAFLRAESWAPPVEAAVAPPPAPAAAAPVPATVGIAGLPPLSTGMAVGVGAAAIGLAAVLATSSDDDGGDSGNGGTTPTSTSPTGTSTGTSTSTRP